MASNVCVQKVLSACVVHMVFTPPSAGFLALFGGICCFHLGTGWLNLVQVNAEVSAGTEQGFR